MAKMTENNDLIVDLDIASFYPASMITASVTFKVTPYRFKKNNENSRRIRAKPMVNEWISNALPKAVEYQGDVYLDNEEYMMLVLRFGAGEEEHK